MNVLAQCKTNLTCLHLRKRKEYIEIWPLVLLNQTKFLTFHLGNCNICLGKKITRSDMQTGLLLIQESNEYLRSLPQAMRDQINAFGLATMCYTPVCNFYVEIGSGPIANNNFRVKKRGWMVIAARNGFNVEDEIDCWALHEAGAGKLNLLIQKVRLIKLTNYYLTKFDIFFYVRNCWYIHLYKFLFILCLQVTN